MRRSPGKMALVAGLVLLLIGAGIAIAKKKHHHRGLPRAPTPRSAAAPSSRPRTPRPTRHRRRTSRPGTRTSPLPRSIRTPPPTSPTSAPTAATSCTRTSARRASTASPTPWSARSRSAPRCTSPPTATSPITAPIEFRSRPWWRAGRPRTGIATCSPSTRLAASSTSSGAPSHASARSRTGTLTSA